MSKFTDSVKGFINKKFTQEVTCCHCNKNGKIMFFSTLMDGKKLCSDCKNRLPSQLLFKAKEETYEDFKKKYDFIQHSRNVLLPVFCPTPEYSYGKFEVDATHRLCRINGGFVFEINKISSYNFNFKAEEFKEGIFSSKVKGDVFLTLLTLEEPFAVFESELIKGNAKGKAEKPLFSRTVIYSNPVEMDEFIARLDSLCESFREEKRERELREMVEMKARELYENRLKDGTYNG